MALNPKQENLYFRIKSTPELQPFFFRKAKGLEWFEPLLNDGFFSPEHNPPPAPAKEEGYYYIPYWPVVEYLVNTSPELTDPAKEEFAKKFIGIIRNNTDYAIRNSFSNWRTWWQFAKILRNIPVHIIEVTDIELINYWLDDRFERNNLAHELGEWLKQLLNEGDVHCNELALKLLGELYSIKLRDEDYGTYKEKEASFRIDEYYSEEITKNVANEVGKKLGLPGVLVFHTNLIDILKNSKHDEYSYIWRPAIEEHEQNHLTHRANSILIQAYRGSLLNSIDSNQVDAAKFIGSLFDDVYVTTQRIAIYALSQKFSILGKQFIDRLLRDEFFNGNYQHELWTLLRDNYTSLNAEQKKTFDAIIANMSIPGDDVHSELYKKRLAYKRAIWLSSIKDYSDELKQLYKQNVDIAGAEPDHPAFSSYSTSGSVVYKSPYSFDMMRSWGVNELIEKISNFKASSSSYFDEQPSIVGLANCFKDVVKAEPLKVYEELSQFLNVDLIYVHELIEAFRELWGEKKPGIPWDDVWSALLKFCLDLIHNQTFWSDINSNQRQVVGAIAHLIEDGTKTDQHAFQKELLETAEKTLILLLDKQKGEDFEKNRDAVSIAINSPRGKCIEALINLSLRSCRIAGDKSKAWEHFEAIYDRELSRSDEGVYEFATLVANYLPNFLYMSETWVNKNLNNIFNQKNYLHWLCAMQGYTYVGNVYEVIFRYLKTNGDFIIALDDEHLNKNLKERIIQNIVVAYFNGYESFQDKESLIFKLFVRKNYEEISKIIWFIWTFRDNNKVSVKVFELWPFLLTLIDFNTKEGKSLASDLCQWSAFVEQIDDCNKVLLASVSPYADENFHTVELIKSLARLSGSQPNEAYEIWLKMLEGCTPGYPEETIEQFLHNILRAGNDGRTKAYNIADIYLKKGNDSPGRFLNNLGSE